MHAVPRGAVDWSSGRTKVCVHAFLAEEVTLRTCQWFTRALKAERATVEPTHRLVAEALLQNISNT
jgi:hypothetical protein